MSGPQKVEKSKAIEILNEALEVLSGLNEYSAESFEFQKWERDTETAIKHIFGKEDDNAKAFQSISYRKQIIGTTISGRRRSRESSPEEDRSAYVGGLDRAKLLLQSMITEIERFWE